MVVDSAKSEFSKARTSNSNDKKGGIKRKEISEGKESTEKEMKTLKVMCEICEAVLSDSSNLKRHEKIHSRSGLKSFKCDECDKTFAAKRYVATHKNACHSGKLFQCKFCDTEFTINGNLLAHKRKFHPNEK